MILLTNKKYDALVDSLARIERKLDAKPRGGATTVFASVNSGQGMGGGGGIATTQKGTLALSKALKQVMMDGNVRNVGQAWRTVKLSGLCRHAVNRQSVNALLSKMFLKGELMRPEKGHYKYKS